MQVYLVDGQHIASTKLRSILFTNRIFSSPAGTIGAFNYIYSGMHDILRYPQPLLTLKNGTRRSKMPKHASCML